MNPMYAIVANPFDYAHWAFYVLHVETGQIVAVSNNEAWCESLILRLA